MTPQAAERRQHGREWLSLPLVMRIEIHGFDAAEERFDARGQTVNVSRGGLLARIDRELRIGTRCLAHFPQAEGRIGRTMVYGEVRRSQPIDNGHEIAVRFDTPLQRLDWPDDVDPVDEP